MVGTPARVLQSITAFCLVEATLLALAALGPTYRRSFVGSAGLLAIFAVQVIFPALVPPGPQHVPATASFVEHLQASMTRLAAIAPWLVMAVELAALAMSFVVDHARARTRRAAERRRPTGPRSA
jgi:hypothetical protein